MDRTTVSVRPRPARTPAFTMTIAVAFVLGMASVLTGCPSFRIQPPPDYVALRHQYPDYHYRAVSAYGVALSVKVIKNRPFGNLDFWTEALDRRLRQSGAYHPQGSMDVQARGGVHGRRLQYGYGDAQNGGTYWVTLFVTDHDIFLLEAGGANDAFARARPGVESAIASFTVL